MSREYSIIFLFFIFFQVIDLIEYKAEDDDDCYELQNILSDPHVAVSENQLAEAENTIIFFVCPSKF